MPLLLSGKWCEWWCCHHQRVPRKCSAAAGQGHFSLVDIWTTKINGKRICAWSSSLSRDFFLTVFLHSVPLWLSFSTFLSERKGWDVCCGSLSGKQLLSSVPFLTSPPPDSQQRVFVRKKSWSVNNKMHENETWGDLEQSTVVESSLTNKSLIMPSLIFNVPAQNTATLRFYCQPIFSG